MSLFGALIQGILEAIACGAVTQEPEKPKPVRDPQDKITPNLYVGKVVPDGMFDWEVISILDNDNIEIRVLKIYHDRMDRYLDEGKVYPVFRHQGWDGTTLEVWEIAPEHMKRDVSQVIIQWEEGLGWCCDLDF